MGVDMSRLTKNPKGISIRIAAVAVLAFGVGGCGATSSVGSMLGAVSDVADVVSVGAKITFLSGGFGGPETLGIDVDNMATALEVIEAADDVSDVADDAAEDAALTSRILNPLLHPPSAAD